MFYIAFRKISFVSWQLSITTIPRDQFNPRHHKTMQIWFELKLDQAKMAANQAKTFGNQPQ